MDMGVPCYGWTMDICKTEERSIMNVQQIGQRIESNIRLLEGLHLDETGFDACFNKTPIEIKGCTRFHRNGCNRKGQDTLTKGRFWIDNEAHKILLKRKGFYVFVLYRMGDTLPLILKYEYMSAKAVDKLIKEGANTKIRYDVIFPEERYEVV